MRSVVRRSKQVAFRRQRVPVEIPPDESAAEEVADDLPNSEKIEVHVHVHREGSKRPAKRAALVQRGKLFEWQWYNDQLSKRPRHTMPGRWSAAASCSACNGLIPASARHCPRCGAPRSRRRLLPIAMALLGLAAFAVVLALSVRILGHSVPEAQAPNPVGRWSDDDVVFVEVPPPSASPFAPAIGRPSSGIEAH